MALEASAHVNRRPGGDRLPSGLCLGAKIGLAFRAALRLRGDRLLAVRALATLEYRKGKGQSNWAERESQSKARAPASAALLGDGHRAEAAKKPQQNYDYFHLLMSLFRLNVLAGADVVSGLGRGPAFGEQQAAEGSEIV